MPDSKYLRDSKDSGAWQARRVAAQQAEEALADGVSMKADGVSMKADDVSKKADGVTKKADSVSWKAPQDMLADKIAVIRVS